MKTLLLLSTTTCQKCPEVKKHLQEKVEGYNIRMIDETDEDFSKWCKDYNATQAPTIILFDDYGEEIDRAGDLEELKEILK